MSGSDFALLAETVRPETRRGIEAALELVGGDRLEPPGAAGHPRARGAIVSLEGLAAAGPGIVEQLRNRPAFVFAECAASGDEHAAGLRVLEELTGIELRLAEPRPIRSYRVARGAEMWPFSGLTLVEQSPRMLASLVPPPEADVQVGVEHGAAVARLRGDADIVVSLVPAADDLAATPLKRAFRAHHFAALLPLLTFARQTLGDSGWRSPGTRAAFIVDDPNLRTFRYGAMDYRRLVAAGREHGFHTAVAMIPIDWRKTSRRVAALVRQNPRSLSLVLHGVEHRKREFGRPVSQGRADAIVAEGVRRMEVHRQRTGIACAPVMTFPHGPYNETWLAALRAAGLQGGTASSTRAATDGPEVQGRLHDMRPAEFVGCGFPIVRRIAIGKQPREEFLFQAWLGKPLLIYTHPAFFRAGVEELCELADYVNSRLQPKWSDLATILDHNLLSRRRNGETQIHAYSNSIVVEPPWAEREYHVGKPAPVIPADESVWLDGIDSMATRETRVPAGTRVTFRPKVLETAARRPRRLSLRSHARRSATELRDRIPAVGRTRKANAPDLV